MFNIEDALTDLIRRGLTVQITGETEFLYEDGMVHFPWWKCVISDQNGDLLALGEHQYMPQAMGLAHEAYEARQVALKEAALTQKARSEL